MKANQIQNGCIIKNGGKRNEKLKVTKIKKKLLTIAGEKQEKITVRGAASYRI